MELAGTLDVLSTIIQWAQGAMASTAEIGWRIAISVWTLTILLSLAVAIGGGAVGVVATFIRGIIFGGVVLGALSMWSTVVGLMYQTVSDMSIAISGRAFEPMETVQRGWDLYMNALWHNMTWSMLLPWNWASAGTINIAGLVVFITFLLLALFVGSATIMFFLSATVAPILFALLFVPALMGFGLSGVGMVLSSTIYMIVFSVIVAAGEAAFISATIPGPGESVTLGMLGQTVVSAVVVAFLAWKASSWAATITRGSAGGTGMNATIAGAAGMLGAGIRGAGSATAGGARGGAGTSAGAAGAGTAAAGGARSGGARGGQSNTGTVGVQTRP